MANVYVNKNGTRIGRKDAMRLQADPLYSVIREYDNGKVRVRALWHGIVDGQASDFYWTPFDLYVENIVSGKATKDPVASKKCKTEQDALNAYEGFLLSWTDSVLDDNDQLEEVGNTLAPIIPETLDTPHCKENADYGSW